MFFLPHGSVAAAPIIALIQHRQASLPDLVQIRIVLPILWSTYYTNSVGQKERYFWTYYVSNVTECHCVDFPFRSEDGLQKFLFSPKRKYLRAVENASLSFEESQICSLCFHFCFDFISVIKEQFILFVGTTPEYTRRARINNQVRKSWVVQEWCWTTGSSIVSTAKWRKIVFYVPDVLLISKAVKTSFAKNNKTINSLAF